MLMTLRGVAHKALAAERSARRCSHHICNANAGGHSVCDALGETCPPAARAACGARQGQAALEAQGTSLKSQVVSERAFKLTLVGRVDEG